MKQFEYGDKMPALCRAMVDAYNDNKEIRSLEAAARIVIQQEEFSNNTVNSACKQFCKYATPEQKDTIEILRISRPGKEEAAALQMRELGRIGCAQSVAEAAQIVEKLRSIFEDDGTQQIKASSARIYWTNWSTEDDWETAGFVKLKRSTNPPLPDMTHDILDVLIARAETKSKQVTVLELMDAFQCTEDQLLAHLNGQPIPSKQLQPLEA